MVDNRVVAALVYRRRRHYINLFVWPSDDAPASEFTATRRGYNVIHWNRSGMSYWAVSDLNRPELEQFVSLLNRTAQP